MILDILVEVLDKTNDYEYKQIASEIKNCPTYQEISVSTSGGFSGTHIGIGIGMGCLALLLIIGITGILIYKKNQQFIYTKN